MVALIHHVRVVDAGRPDHTHLVKLLLLFKHFIGALTITQQHLHLVLLVLFELRQLLLLRLHEDLLEDELVLLLALRGERSVGALRFLLVSEAHGVCGSASRSRLVLLSLLEQ